MDEYTNTTVSIRKALLEQAPNPETFYNITGGVIFSAVDFVCDGEALSDLEPCEKTYIGTRVERKLLTAFNLPKEKPLDTTIAGTPVDIKFTLNNNWMIPPECVGQYCLLIKADPEQRTYSLGIFQAREENLTNGGNRDRKRCVSKAGKDTIDWLTRNYKA